MTQAEAPAPNFVLVGIDLASEADFSVEYTARINPVTDALEILSLDTPSSDIKPEHSPELNRLMSRMFMEF